MKLFANELIPGDNFHPSELIKDELEARNMRQVDLINLSGLSQRIYKPFTKWQTKYNQVQSHYRLKRFLIFQLNIGFAYKKITS